MISLVISCEYGEDRPLESKPIVSTIVTIIDEDIMDSIVDDVPMKGNIRHLFAILIEDI